MDEFDVPPELIYLPHCGQIPANSTCPGNSGRLATNSKNLHHLNHSDCYRVPISCDNVNYSSPYYFDDSRLGGFAADRNGYDVRQCSDALPSLSIGVDVTEMRREKSRDAARSRRGKENFEFLSLSRLLPLPSAITGQLDKASVIRLCISTLKLRKFARLGDPSWPMTPSKTNPTERRLAVPVLPTNFSKEAVESNFGSNVLQAHDGFVLALSADGIILYISETVSVYLGLSQVELTGSSLFEYLHEEDRLELAEALCIPWDPAVVFQDMEPPTRLSSQEPSSDSEDGVLFGPLSPRPERRCNIANKEKFVLTMPGWKSCYHKIKTNYCVRFRSTLTKRGVQMKYSGYRVLSLQWGPRLGSAQTSMNLSSENNHLANSMSGDSTINYGFTMCATALPSLNMNELRLDKSSFTMKLTLDFRIISCDLRIQELLEYSPELIVDDSFYNLTYGNDHDLVCELHRDVLRKGQTLSSYYRIMRRQGGYYWTQTCAHLMASNKTPNDQCIVVVHTLLSNIQHEEVAFGIQFPSPSSAKSITTPVSNKDEKRRTGSDQSLIQSTASSTTVIAAERKRKLPRIDETSQQEHQPSTEHIIKYSVPHPTGVNRTEEKNVLTQSKSRKTLKGNIHN